MRLSAPIHRLKRRARSIARIENIALHEALDRVARQEGMAAWSLLSARLSTDAPNAPVFTRLRDGDLLLLGARPGHGKTMLGLQLLCDAVRARRRAVFFTLEWTARDVAEALRALNGPDDPCRDKLEVVLSDEICADVIVRQLSGAPRGTVAVIDYLQILDQRRTKAPLADQLQVLRDCATRNGWILGFVSQIDRGFDPDSKPVPDLGDIRLPNPIDVGIFSKACFLHGGEMRFHEVA